MENRTGRYAALTKRLVDSVLATPGHLASDARQAVLARAARLGGRPSSPLSQRERGIGAEDIPPALADYVDKVALHAYTVTDQDLATLKQAGNSDDVLFEATVSAALGAALGRLERGLSALCGEASAPDPLSTLGPHPLTPSPFGRGGTRE